MNWQIWILIIAVIVPALLWALRFKGGWAFIKCLFGFHLPAEYCGEVHIYKMDHDTHELEYGNVRRCPRCHSVVSIDNLH